MQIHGHRCGRRRVGVVCMCCPRMWVAMMLTGSGRSLHHAAAASDSGCGGSGGGRVVVASKHRSGPRRRGKPARVIQLKASFDHTAVHPTPRRQYFRRCTFQHRRPHFKHFEITDFLGYIFRRLLVPHPEGIITPVSNGLSLVWKELRRENNTEVKAARIFELCIAV